MPIDFGGVLLDAAGAVERAPDGLALGPVEVLPQVQRRQARRRRRCATPSMRTTSGPIDRRRRQHDGALDGVLELAHVAGPVGRLQRLEHARLDAVDALAGALRVLAR